MRMRTRRKMHSLGGENLYLPPIIDARVAMQDIYQNQRRWIEPGDIIEHWTLKGVPDFRYRVHFCGLESLNNRCKYVGKYMSDKRIPVKVSAAKTRAAGYATGSGALPRRYTTKIPWLLCVKENRESDLYPVNILGKRRTIVIRQINRNITHSLTREESHLTSLDYYPVSKT